MVSVVLQLPRARDEGVGLRRQRADRAEVDHVAAELGGHRLLDVGADFHVLAAEDRAELLDARDLVGEADAARAMDAARHDRLDQRPDILVAHRALALVEAAEVAAVGHRLVLQVALAALIADGAIQRVIDEQELHHPFPRLLDLLRIGADHHAVRRRHGAGRDGLRRALHLHQAHAAVAGDGEPVVEAEVRDLLAGCHAGLHHRRAGLDRDLGAVDGERRHRPASSGCGRCVGCWKRRQQRRRSPSRRGCASRAPAGSGGSGPAPATPRHRRARRSCVPRSDPPRPTAGRSPRPTPRP